MKIDECAKQAAAYAVAMINYGLLEKIDFIQIKDDEGDNYPKVRVDGSDKSTYKYWWIIAAMASEIITLAYGKKPRWDSIELEGIDIAARLTREAPDGFLYGVGHHLCWKWWDMPEGEEKRRNREIAEDAFMALWPDAIALVKRYHVTITDLAKKLRKCQRGEDGYTVMEGCDLVEWWNNRKR